MKRKGVSAKFFLKKHKKWVFPGGERSSHPQERKNRIFPKGADSWGGPRRGPEKAVFFVNFRFFSFFFVSQRVFSLSWGLPETDPAETPLYLRPPLDLHP